MGNKKLFETLEEILAFARLDLPESVYEEWRTRVYRRALGLGENALFNKWRFAPWGSRS